MANQFFETHDAQRRVKASMIPSTIIEAAVSLTEGFSYTYKIPEDREKRLYDFYLLSLYKGLMDNPYYHKRLVTLAGMDDDTVEDLEAIVNDGTKELEEEIRRDLLDALVTAVSAEFKHIWDANSSDAIEEFMKKRNSLDNFKKWARKYYTNMGSNNIPEPWKRDEDKIDGEGSSETYTAAYRATIRSGWNIRDFMETAKEAFIKLRWSSSYGGISWANIANSWLKLSDASRKDWPIWIDHVFDLEHNTGTMLNKVERFKKDGNYRWIKKALDAKFDMTPVELGRASSLPISVVGRLNRITGASESVEDHDRNKRKEMDQEDAEEEYIDKNNTDEISTYPDTMGGLDVHISYHYGYQHPGGKDKYIANIVFPEDKPKTMKISKDGSYYTIWLYEKNSRDPYTIFIANEEKNIINGLVSSGFDKKIAKKMAPHIQDIVKKIQKKQEYMDKSSSGVFDFGRKKSLRYNL